MTFGRRGGGAAQEPRQPPSSLPVLAIAIAVVIVAAAVAMTWALALPSASQRFATSALELGVTDAMREQLGAALQSALTDLDEVPCDEGLQSRAGKAAVAYYETLLEKPIVAAGLMVTFDSYCRELPSKNDHPLTPLVRRLGLGANLRLPWSCMPDGWRTPLHRALQTRLEAGLATGRLPADALTGTLSMIARPQKQGALAYQCNRRALPYRPNLPVQAAPQDDWDRAPRARFRR